ncbi:MAG: pyrrolo-quinoline quinone [Bryobacterales bacterium]|nr:pyrrolo-quinoline quinone [Bryobacterales bacterium]
MKTLVALLLAAGAAFSEDWPQFRGPLGQGHSEASGLPLTWSQKENVRWKVEIPGHGWSSPAIQGSRIWLTTATENGRSLRVISIDKDSGRISKDVEVFRVASPEHINAKNNPASPTPILEGDRVYVHYGAQGTAALTAAGEIVWKTHLKYEHQHGPGGSPALYRDLLLISCDGTDTQYVVALDKNTGKIRWKRPRKGYQAYTTPLVISSNGEDQVVSVGAHRTIAYDPANGKELWSIQYGDGFSNVPRPVFANGLVYITSGFFQPVLFAVKPDGKGDVTDTHVAWSIMRAVPLTPSPLAVGDELYIVSDNGIATCLDGRTGKAHWQQRMGSNYSASPLYAAGRIYFLSEDGETTVIAPGREFKKLASNPLEEPTLASIAVSDNALFIRSERNLYRIENSK